MWSLLESFLKEEDCQSWRGASEGRKGGDLRREEDWLGMGSIVESASSADRLYCQIVLSGGEAVEWPKKHCWYSIEPSGGSRPS